jgi:transcription-repair coupling factor (superfamily II helicase)
LKRWFGLIENKQNVETLIKHVGGVTRGAFPWWLLNRGISGKALILVSQEEDVAPLVDDLKSLQNIPADWGSLSPLAVAAYAVDDEPSRAAALFNWHFGKTSVLVASQEGWSLPCDTPELIRKKTFPLKPGVTIPRDKFESILGQGGYLRNDRSDQVGEYAIRGDVIDIWPPIEPAPLRITWNFDTVEALRTINLYTQRSEDYQRETTLFAVSPGEGDQLSSFVTPSTDVFLFDPTPELLSLLSQQPLGSLYSVHAATMEGENFQFTPPPSFAGHIEFLKKQLAEWSDDDWRVLIFCHNQGECDRLQELLDDPANAARGIRPEWLPPMVIGDLEHGFVDPVQRCAVLANSEIFGRFRKRIRVPKFEGAGGFSSPLDIATGDFLVHEKYGVGRYIGLRTLKVGRVNSEYLNIEYKGGDRVYVPIFEIQQVQKYLGAEGKRPALSSLDTATWERVKSKVKEEVAKLAAELLRKAAKRSIRPGYAFPPQSHLEKEFAESFMYKLTNDQKKTLEEVESDMVSAKAMDRLICGDVGYGKTEVAMRASLKAALAGKQVAVLCPTTILAEQHYRTFSERMADYPVTLGLLSRFQDKAEQKVIMDKVSKGGVDIVIGTHRLLSADMAFHDLGLLVIDEEHRFGVKQKSHLLSLRETVDVLSLTATPIPRTLASSLGGIKDLSIIETPPEGRLPISTYVGAFDEDVMVQAVQKEFDRGGQVFYVHNRVQTLQARKEWLEGIMPGVRIAMAHGQMTATELEKAMHDFLHRKVDVLLATTIIESGLDMPSVNTLIAEEAEELGLSQLYQLRGRVGRSATRAFCYLFYSPERMSTDAKKRLDALKEFTSLGSGLKLAMRDMEIRGAGNLLGPQQHGSMAAVGIETYSRLLNEEIARLKGQGVSEEERSGPLMELSLSAYLPDDYLPSESERVQMYKRILSADENGLQKIKEELVDLCGALPESGKLLFDTAALRLIARKKGISEVHQEEDCLLIYFRTGFQVPDNSFSLLLNQPDNVLTLIPGKTTGVRFYFVDGENALDTFGRFLRLVFPA